MALATLGALAALPFQSVHRASAASVVYVNPSAPFQYGVIGDSAWAGIRWINSWGPMQRFSYRADLESCRRTLEPSCRGREGYAPTTTLTALRQQSGGWGAVLVVATGYNDPGSSFGQAVDSVMQEAMRQNISRVVWMTMRTAEVTYVAPGFRSNTYTFADNNRILLLKEQQYGGRLVIADWAGYSANHPEWFTSDGVHLRPAGGEPASRFIAASAEAVMNGLTPPGAPELAWSALVQGSQGERVTLAQRALIAAGYPISTGTSGIYDLPTGHAALRFQMAAGLSPTGLVDLATARALGLVDSGGSIAGSAVGWVVLRQGSLGPRVNATQDALATAGFDVPASSAGVYDPATGHAVLRYQMMPGLAPTGLVDVPTAIELGLIRALGSPTNQPVGSSSWITLVQGSSGSLVIAAQQALISRNFPISTGASGQYNLPTGHAVLQFQMANSMYPSGLIDRPTAIALGLLAAPASFSGVAAGWQTLVQGSTGGRVTAAQEAVMAAGFAISTGASSRYDLATGHAILQYQMNRGLSPTGLVDLPTALGLGLVVGATDPAPTLGSATWITLGQGSTGTRVAAAQRAVIAAGYPISTGVTGRYDLATGHAILRYQMAYGMYPSGLVDVATAIRLGLVNGPVALVAAAARAVEAVEAQFGDPSACGDCR